MKQNTDLLDIGTYEVFKPDKTMLVSELLEELNLTEKWFAILVNDKKAKPDTVITPEDEVVIIPFVGGGTRDPARIKRICELLEEKWKKYPDQRLGQFLMNYVFGNIGGKHTAFIFYQEDDKNEQRLKDFESIREEMLKKSLDKEL